MSRKVNFTILGFYCDVLFVLEDNFLHLESLVGNEKQTDHFINLNSYTSLSFESVSLLYLRSLCIWFLVFSFTYLFDSL